VLASLVRKKKFQGQDYIFGTNHLNFKGIHQNGETSRSRRYSSSLCGGGEAAYAYAASSPSSHVAISRPSNPAVLQARLPSIPTTDSRNPWFSHHGQTRNQHIQAFENG
jgi:hypothetical protein